MSYKMSVGLEIHAELLSKTKIFCSCENKFGGKENTRCCPVCMGFPGTLPVLNKKAVELCIMAGLALNCEISESFSMARKNYFYPDLPKAYQISQSENPICKNGYLDTKYGRVGILNIHIEEDAGKLIHRNNETLIDYNRCGVPLIEIVTAPDMHSKEHVNEFLQSLKKLLKSIAVSDCNMQEGSLRCDVNVSMQKEGDNTPGERCEYKNINTFKGAVNAVEYEIKRQSEILNFGGKVERETRRWDDITKESTILRKKENMADYHYFEEPDIPTVKISPETLLKIKQKMPETSEQKKQRYMKEFSLCEYDAELLSQNNSNLFEEAVKNGALPKDTANLILGDISKLVNEGKKLTFGGDKLAKLLCLQDKKIINKTIAKQVLEIMFESGEDPEKIVQNNNLAEITDAGIIEEIVLKTLSENQKAVLEYNQGKKQAFSFLLGKAMEKSNKKANVHLLKEALQNNLKK